MTSAPRWFLALLLVALALPDAAVARTPPATPSPEAIDAAVSATIARYQLPGIAVGVVADGKVVYARGHGETVAGSGQPVTGATLFKIASNSKAMTAAVLARLVQQGRLDWDDPVVKHLPAFAMHDPWVTRNMTVRDLLVHNSGLPEGGGDLMLWPEPNLFTRDDIVRGLRHIPPAYGFRAGYAYDNLLYVVAGQVAAAAGGASYEELVRRELFAPLGLAGCRVGGFRLADAGSVAQPHARVDGHNALTRADADLVPEIASAPAGGIRCTLDDMLAWMRNWLAPDASQLAWLGPAQRAEMWKARTPMPISALRKRWDDTHYYAYAYGFRVADADGEWTVSHTGTLGGMYSMMLLLPDRRSGFVFMINGEGGNARTVLGEVLLKLFTAPDASLGVDGYADDLARPVAPDGRRLHQSGAARHRHARPGDRGADARVARHLARPVVRRGAHLRGRRRRRVARVEVAADARPHQPARRPPLPALGRRSGGRGRLAGLQRQRRRAQPAHGQAQPGGRLQFGLRTPGLHPGGRL